MGNIFGRVGDPSLCQDCYVYIENNQYCYPCQLERDQIIKEFESLLKRGEN